MERRGDQAARSQASEKVRVIGMKQALRILGLAIGALAAVAIVIAASAAGLYKWVDDKGVVHYSDQAPAETPANGTTMLDKQGRQVKKIEPPLTPEQLKAKAAEDERERALAKVKADQERQDKALMQSYSSEEEIDIAKARAISTLDSQMKSAQAYGVELARQQKVIAAKKASYGSQPIPIELERESAAVDSELSRQTILVRQKQDELGRAEAKYDTIKQRWHEILANQAAEAAKGTKASSNKSATMPPPASSTAASK